MQVSPPCFHAVGILAELSDWPIFVLPHFHAPSDLSFSPLKQSEEPNIKLAFSESSQQNHYDTPRCK